MLGVIGIASAQQVVEIGVLYQPGDSLYGPRNGVMASMPEGWVGGVPEGTALFVMESLTHNDAQIYVRPGKDNLDQIKERWSLDLKLSRSIDVRLVGEITSTAEGIAAEFKNLANPNARIYGQAKCGDYGSCVIVFLNAWKGSYDAALVDAKSFVEQIRLVEPYMKNLHDNFDWKTFLTDKYVYAYVYDGVQEKSNNLWLCGDGTFKLDVKRKGAAFVKNNKKYYGKSSGTWTVDGVGPTAEVRLEFAKKKEPFAFEIEIRENKIYIGGERHFTVNNTDCK